MTAPNPHDPAPVSAPVPYDPTTVEAKWQNRWRERGTHHTDLAEGERPFYALMMFPYPSAEGLHVGNLFAFTGNDIYGRFQRLQGHTVFEPLGYDAFGIHSENYALKVGEHPMRLIPRNIANFRRQLERAGLMVDWRYSLDTTDPRYYRWTQWIFLKLYEKGLAYKKKAAVNWCPNDKTVLANEQVINGACERCGFQVEQRFLEQWFFRISEYAERPAEQPGPHRLVREHEDGATELDRSQRWRGGRVRGHRNCGRIPDSCFHDSPRHDLRRDVSRPRSRASAGHEPNDAGAEGRGRVLSRAHQAAGPRVAQSHQGEDGRLHRQPRDQPCHRRAHSDLDR
jgi:hypothetical protein